MKASELLNQVKTLLNIEVKLETEKLDNGTTIEAEKFEVGAEVFIVTDDEKVALPIGDYTLENGDALVVAEEGVITEIGTKEEEPKEEPKEEEMADETKYASQEEVDAIKLMVEEILSHLKEKEDLKAEEKLSEVKKEELSLEKELSEPATEPINTNAPIDKGEVNFKISPNKKETTMDRVLRRMNNIN